MSIGNFIERFGTEEQCSEHLFSVRFCENPQFVCPGCSGTSFYSLKSRHRPNASTRSPLSYYVDHPKISFQNWFNTIYLMTIGKRGVFAMELQYHLGITYKTAWYLLLRIRTAMAAANDKYILEGTVVMDEAFFSGKSALSEGAVLKRGDQGFYRCLRHL